ncbi:MAG: hypothetical protein J5I92_15030 [Thiogranum sp.]|nr:hypothetical protein [Thiogranum sp.]
MSRLLTQPELLEWLGYQRPSDLKKALLQLGVRPIIGRDGAVCCTTGALDRAMTMQNDPRNVEDEDDEF